MWTDIIKKLPKRNLVTNIFTPAQWSKGWTKLKFFFAFLETTNISKIYGTRENFQISLLLPDIER